MNFNQMMAESIAGARTEAKKKRSKYFSDDSKVGNIYEGIESLKGFNSGGSGGFKSKLRSAAIKAIGGLFGL